MKIDTTMIEGYDKMTPEEKLAALEDFEYNDGSDEIQRLKSANTKASNEAAEYKRKYKEKLSKEEQKAQEAAEKQKQMEEELEKLRLKDKVSTYKAKLLADGYDEALAQASAEALAKGDTDTFFTNQKKFIAAHDKAYKAELMKQNLEPGGGDPPAPKTKEEIMKITDAVERQQAIMDNPELFGLQLD
ncbi:MAG: hypothetical protein IJH07_05480 [Ruminococcus sp.]|nr:hypothetical protein [Ruminococcus sp.]